MASSGMVIVVTGGDDGVGAVFLDHYCKNYPRDVHIYFTSMDVKRAQATIEKYKKGGYDPIFHQMDITDQESVNKFRDFLRTQHGGINKLMNCAALPYESRTSEPPLPDQAKDCIRVNYFGTLRVCEALCPLIRRNGTLKNIISSSGYIDQIPDPDIQALLQSNSLDIPALSKCMEDYVKYMEENEYQRWIVPVPNHTPPGKRVWGRSSPFAVSKMGVEALTYVQQRMFKDEEPNRMINVKLYRPRRDDADRLFYKEFLTIDRDTRAHIMTALKGDFDSLQASIIASADRIVQW